MKKLKLTKKGKKIIGVLAGIASLLTIILVFLILSLNTDIASSGLTSIESNLLSHFMHSSEIVIIFR